AGPDARDARADGLHDADQFVPEDSRVCDGSIAGPDPVVGAAEPGERDADAHLVRGGRTGLPVLDPEVTGGAKDGRSQRTLPARNPRPSGRGGAPVSMVDRPRLELRTPSASKAGDNQAGRALQPSKRRWCRTGRLPRSMAGR